MENTIFMDDSGLKTKVKGYITTRRLILPGDHMIAAVSGGADSVCLLLLLEELKTELGITLEAVHVEHGIRREESRADAEFVKRLCRKKQISCRIYPVCAKEFAAEKKYSLEEAARILRYRALQKSAEEWPAADRVKIAVAHNREDQAETILFHMIRGSSLAGLCGMKPEQGKIIRPLLDVSRQEIEKYLIERNQPFCTDSTNWETDYARNRLRHQVFPLLKEINVQAVEHICRLGEETAQAGQYLEKQAKEAYENCRCRHGTEVIGLNIGKMNEYSEMIRNRMIYLALSECSGTVKDITAEHVGQAAALTGKQTGKKISLPYYMYARRQYEYLLIGKQTLSSNAASEENLCRNRRISGHDAPEKNLCRDLLIPGSVVWPDGMTVTTKIFDFDGKMRKIPKNRFTKWYDYDTINGSLQLRNRKSGDFLTIGRNGKTKKLKKYFVDEKIPQQTREYIPLIASGQHILWVIGYRGGQFAEVVPETRRVLEIHVSGGTIT